MVELAQICDNELAAISQNAMAGEHFLGLVFYNGLWIKLQIGALVSAAEIRGLK